MTLFVKDIQSATEHELIDARRQIDDAIQFIRKNKKEHAIAHIKKMAAENGLVVALQDKRRAKPQPKYANPSNPSETWAGRGRTPRWLSTLESNGLRRDDFLINHAQSTLSP